MRLRQPTVLLEGLERTRTQVETRWAPRATVHLRVDSEDELRYRGAVMPPK